MSDLPPGWEWTTVGEAGKVELGMARSPARHHGPNMKPYLRVANVFEDRFDLTDVMQMNFTPEEFDRYSVQPGDILLNEGQSPELLGRPALWRGEPGVYAFTNSLIRFQAHSDVLPEWALLVFRHYMHVGRFTREVRITTNIAHLSSGRFKSIGFPLPPLTEQRRIVDMVDELTSCILECRKHLRKAMSGAAYLRQSSRLSTLLDTTGRPGRLSEVVERIEAGRSGGSSAPCAKPDEWGVIKVSAMTWGEFKPGENKRVPDDFADPRFEIRSDDLLVSRANTADYVGAPVLVGEVRPKLLLSDKSLRVVPKAGTDRRWLLHSLASPTFRSYVSATATGTKDSMRNISQAALLAGPIHFVDPDRQREIADEIDEHMASAKRLDVATEAAEERARQLHQSILEMAFSGRLVSQDPDNDSASSLLDRLRAEQAVRARVSRPARQRSRG